MRRTATADARKDQATGVKTVNQYTLLSEAGRGSFCKVKWATDSTGRRHAVKVFAKGVLDRREVSFFDKNGASTISLRQRIDEELRILAGLQHSSVVVLTEVIDDPNHEKMYAVMEGLRGGQLMAWDEDLAAYSIRASADEVRQHWGDQVQYGAVPWRDDGVLVFREGVAAAVLQQLVGAVAYLHGLPGQGIIHKDLKPDNIFLTAPLPSGDPRFAGRLAVEAWPDLQAPAPGVEASDVRPLVVAGGLVAKIGDFNSAAACAQPDCLIYDAEGTQLFTPPECFDGRAEILGKPRDVWSLGCVLFAMLFGRCPFWAQENIRLQIAVMTEDLAVPGGVVSPGAEGLLRSLLNKAPAARPTAANIAQHAWLGQGGFLQPGEVAPQ